MKEWFLLIILLAFKAAGQQIGLISKFADAYRAILEPYKLNPIRELVRSQYDVKPVDN